MPGGQSVDDPPVKEFLERAREEFKQRWDNPAQINRACQAAEKKINRACQAADQPGVSGGCSKAILIRTFLFISEDFRITMLYRFVEQLRSIRMNIN
ncbi:hypothetical protein Tcan_09231 [Toxocara canis]|uniref:Uncharacterized protein n=1 Tax=Toxocara canis TaxID=6265 RepID=A0A0B2VKQ6_TOXCA|nr:hypothetical protein Tcan_09231 [Toxocara canis]